MAICKFSQLGQSARSTAQFHEMRKTEKQTAKKPIHVEKLGGTITVLMETVVFFCVSVFRDWPGQPVGQSAWPSTQPTGLARQLRQSARSTAHCDKICKTRKPKTNTCTETGKL